MDPPLALRRRNAPGSPARSGRRDRGPRSPTRHGRWRSRSGRGTFHPPHGPRRGAGRRHIRARREPQHARRPPAGSRGSRITSLRTVPVRRDRIQIPEPVDLLFVSATYHHLPDPQKYFTEARAHLRPGARVAILESRREGLLAPWSGRHASSPRRVQRDMAEAGYRLMATHDIVRGYWFGLFEVA